MGVPISFGTDAGVFPMEKMQGIYLYVRGRNSI